LVPDFYKSNSAMKSYIDDSSLPFVPVLEFTRDALEKRSELMYAMTTRIWQV
jgi:hypothetical protein